MVVGLFWLVMSLGERWDVCVWGGMSGRAAGVMGVVRGIGVGDGGLGVMWCCGVGRELRGWCGIATNKAVRRF